MVVENNLLIGLPTNKYINIKKNNTFTIIISWQQIFKYMRNDICYMMYFLKRNEPKAGSRRHKNVIISHLFKNLSCLADYLTYDNLLTNIFITFLHIFRIALALRESEDLNTEHSTIMNHPSRHNRRTVVRMQSKKSS